PSSACRRRPPGTDASSRPALPVTTPTNLPPFPPRTEPEKRAASVTTSEPACLKRDTSVMKEAVFMLDPVCGVDIVGKPEATSHYKNKTYKFCSKVCKQEFES